MNKILIIIIIIIIIFTILISKKNNYETFYKCNKNVVVPNNIKILSRKKKIICEILESVKFQKKSKVQIIDSSTFENSKLIKIELPNSLKIIKYYAFRNCIKLLNIKIPKSVKSIYEKAFYNCISLKNISFENSIDLKIIDKKVFSQCKNLEKIIIPKSVENINKSSFKKCYKLKTVIFEKNSKLKKIWQYAFAECKSLEYITLPKNLIEIEICAFGFCNLKKVILEKDSKLEKVHPGSFLYNTNLETIDFPKKAKKYIKKIWNFHPKILELYGNSKMYFEDFVQMEDLQILHPERYHINHYNKFLLNLNYENIITKSINVYDDYLNHINLYFKILNRGNFYEKEKDVYKKIKLLPDSYLIFIKKIGHKTNSAFGTFINKNKIIFNINEFKKNTKYSDRDIDEYILWSQNIFDKYQEHIFYKFKSGEPFRIYYLFLSKKSRKAKKYLKKHKKLVIKVINHFKKIFEIYGVPWNIIDLLLYLPQHRTFLLYELDYEEEWNYKRDILNILNSETHILDQFQKRLQIKKIIDFLNYKHNKKY